MMRRIMLVVCIAMVIGSLVIVEVQSSLNKEHVMEEVIVKASKIDLN